MNTRHVAASAVLTTLLALTAVPLAAQADADAAREAVQQLRDEYFSNYKAETAAEAAQLFAEEGVLMPQASPLLVGREEIQGHIERFLSEQTVSFSGLSEETVVLEDRVLDRGYLSVEVSAKGSDAESSDTGKYVLHAVRGEQGWQIEWFIWSLDHPLRQTSD